MREEVGTTSLVHWELGGGRPEFDLLFHQCKFTGTGGSTSGSVLVYIASFFLQMGEKPHHSNGTSLPLVFTMILIALSGLISVLLLFSECITV